MKPYDFMALVPIVQGAGGAITNWRVSVKPFSASLLSRRQPGLQAAVRPARSVYMPSSLP